MGEGTMEHKTVGKTTLHASVVAPVFVKNQCSKVEKTYLSAQPFWPSLWHHKCIWHLSVMDITSWADFILLLIGKGANQHDCLWSQIQSKKKMLLWSVAYCWQNHHKKHISTYTRHFQASWHLPLESPLKVGLKTIWKDTLLESMRHLQRMKSVWGRLVSAFSSINAAISVWK